MRLQHRVRVKLDAPALKTEFVEYHWLQQSHPHMRRSARLHIRRRSVAMEEDTRRAADRLGVISDAYIQERGCGS